ncbi:MAG: hypothetical protein HFJ80_03990 [Clostridiales bacterium]|nr:hypothetical protein [Clostridiales bacterium]
MEPFLQASGVGFSRRAPGQSLSDAIHQSNTGGHALHLSLHTGAGAGWLAGQRQGAGIYYSPSSVRGRRAAEIFATHYRELYPYPAMVGIHSSVSLAEVNRTRAPAILLSAAWRDNPEDAWWLRENIKSIGRTLAQSAIRFLGLPFVEPLSEPERENAAFSAEGMASTSVPAPWAEGEETDEHISCGRGSVCLMEEPHPLAVVLGTLPNGAKVQVLGSADGWAAVRYAGREGYAPVRYLRTGPVD